MAQQTALDFFLMKLVDLEIGKTFYPNQHQDLQDAFKQAKAMEKEQIIKSHCDGFYKSAEGWNGEYGLNDISNIVEEINAEQYYNQTFNN